MSAFLVEQGQSGEGLALEIQLVLGICGHAGIMLGMREGDRAFSASERWSEHIPSAWSST